MSVAATVATVAAVAVVVAALPVADLGRAEEGPHMR